MKIAHGLLMLFGDFPVFEEKAAAIEIVTNQRREMILFRIRSLENIVIDFVDPPIEFV